MAEPTSSGTNLKRSAPAPQNAEKRPAVAAEPEPPTSLVSWIVGWVALPGAVVAGLFGAGVFVGVHFHDAWFTRAIDWVVRLFV